MKFPWRFLTLVLAVVAGSLLLAACGGGEESEELGLDEYFRQLDAIEESMYTSIGALDEESEGTIGEDIEATRDYIDSYHDIVEQGVNDVKDLHPPAEARDAQDEFVAALSNMLPLWEELSDRVADAETPSELQALLVGTEGEAPWQEASQRFTDACRGLQGIADEKGIDVALDCE